MPKHKLVIIDGNSLLYRAYYALPTTLTTKSGVVTNAVYGFTSMLINLIKNEKPDCLAVAFDSGRATFREEILQEYKAHRAASPEDIRHQFPLVKEVLESLNIPIYESPGFEADDVLATIATQAAKEGHEVIIVTGDKDAFQLINDNVKVMTTRKGISDIVVYDRKKVVERYGVGPEKMLDMLGLKGDPSDNIPGVPGVGEKTATKLILEYGSLEDVLEHADEIKGEKLKASLKEYAEQAKDSKKVATAILDVPVDVDYGLCALGWDLDKAEETFHNLEFGTLLQRVKEISPETEATEVFQVKLEEIKDIQALEKLVDKLKGSQVISFSSNSENHQIKELYFGIGTQVYGVSIEKLGVSALASLKEVLESDITKIAFASKETILNLLFEGIELKNLTFDCRLAAYLIRPGADYSLKRLAYQYLGLNLADKEDGHPAESVVVAEKLQPILKKELKELNLEKVYYEIELALLPVLANVEFRGVGIDVAELKKYSEQLSSMIDGLQHQIFEYAEEDFNINSPQQLSQVLFEKLKLKTSKKTKTGFSTDSSVLLKLINEHPIIEAIINYRELAKLKSTYIDALPALVDKKTKRLHTCFNQEGTATGRLSSHNPNLQNIPVRTEIGREIRKSFVPANTTDELMVADYSQIELRILSHLSKDKALIKAFESGHDIHTATAAEVFGVSLDKVTSELRYRAKAVNFGIVYGISAHGLSEQLGISHEEAATYIQKYFKRYPDVREFIDNLIKQAYKDGYVATLYGRRRFIDELKSGDIRIRNFGERTAVNAVMQGSAADIIKVAMIAIEKELQEKGLLTRMVLQVHDELIFEVPSLERTVAEATVKDLMENTTPLTPKPLVDIHFGKNWLEAKE
ncbi:MAG: DNA polymerase I [Actinobacteria bacterium]|nr:MAG: DNA polymerase I [Actinomycetota bacterium]